MDGASVTALLSGLLFHPERVTRDRCAGLDPHALAAMAEHEQVAPLALRALRQRGCDAGAVQTVVRSWMLHEALEREVVREVLERAAGVRSMFFKGASLAFTTYDEPHHRMRVDWDLLVDSPDFDAIERALLESGFEKDLKTPRGIRNRQQSYRRPLASGECVIDVHTGVVNAPALATRIHFEDLYARSVALPALHPAARGAGASDALILACLHRLSHHSGENRLIWDYDIYLLSQRMDGPAVIARSAEWRVGPLVALEVERVTAQAPPAPTWLDALAAQPCDLLDLARANRSRGDDFLLDWRQLGWRERAALVRETLLPNAAYVRESAASSMPLPWLYLRRVVRGAAAWLSRPRQSGR